MKKRFPSAIGIGVKKCGTDGLIRFLDHHPLVKIPHNVDSEAFFFNRNFKRGMEYYRNIFPQLNDKQISMEKTPSYFDEPPHNLPESIIKNLPKVKLFLIVCDPAKRAFSDYVHERVRYEVFNWKLVAKYDTFDDYLNVYLPEVDDMVQKMQQVNKSALDIQKQLTNIYRTDPAKQILTIGLYYYHIQRWFRVFNNSNLMIIDGEDFLRNPGPIIEKIQEFLNLPKVILKEDFVKNSKTGFFCYRKLTERFMKKALVLPKKELVSNLSCLSDSKGRTRMGLKTPSNSSIERLQKFYEPHNKAFYELIGKDYY